MGTISVTTPADGETIDGADVATPINTIVTAINGNLDNANINASAAITGSKLATASLDIGSLASTWDGWIAVSDSWAYASATTITVPTNATTKYSVGDKIKLTNSGTKYFYITAVAATTLTVYGGTDYTVANAAITGVYYSKVTTPLDFPGKFAFTPTWTNLTVGTGGSAYNTAYYSQMGNRAFMTGKMSFGSSGPSMGTSPYFVTPTTVNTTVYPSGANYTFGNHWSTGPAATSVGQLLYNPSLATNAIQPVVNSAFYNATGFTATMPWTWAAGNYIAYDLSYLL